MFSIPCLTLYESTSILLELLNPRREGEGGTKLPSLMALCLAALSAASCCPIKGLEILPIDDPAERFPAVLDLDKPDAEYKGDFIEVEERSGEAR